MCIRDSNNTDLAGKSLRVEVAGSRNRAASTFSGGGTPGKRYQWRVTVEGMPRDASWQDLKDFLRKHGDVVFADVRHDGKGVGEFSSEDSMKAAIKHLDGTEMERRGETSVVTVRQEGAVRDSSPAPKPARRDRSRSRSRSQE
eukprot:TRINITY_DN5972_c0_g1_i2.p1 TRINITY_DN5972_c0_g1~~TRINITY_DN5972_c0_g1_i2.p1  ORF type:complete len:143 (-),score=38.75 TRINITY_DN5972_c0_g1_i2:141-569(-)